MKEGRYVVHDNGCAPNPRRGLGLRPMRLISHNKRTRRGCYLSACNRLVHELVLNLSKHARSSRLLMFDE
jgi:hypothetical protein